MMSDKRPSPDVIEKQRVRAESLLELRQNKAAAWKTKEINEVGEQGL